MFLHTEVTFVHSLRRCFVYAGVAGGARHQGCFLFMRSLVSAD